VRDELGLAVGTFFHPGPPLNERNETNQTKQRTKMNKEESKGKNHIVFSDQNYRNYKEGSLNLDIQGVFYCGGVI
jgi:hypothetical protein